MRTVKQRRMVAGSIVIFLIAICSSILFRDFQAPECTRNVSGPVGTQVLINCDSAQIVQDSQNLQRLINADTSYQDRPLFPFMGFLLSQPIKRFITSYKVFENTDGKEITFYYANYLAFIAINFLLLLLIWQQILSFLKKITKSGQFSFREELILGGAISSLLVANNVFKGFFWTPHTQLFNMVIVIVSVNLWLDLESDSFHKRSKAFFFLNGLLLFFYPMFVVLYLLPLIFSWRRYLLSTVLSISPYLAYPLLLNALGGQYRNAAVEDFNGFVWVLDLRQNPGILLDKIKIFCEPLLQLAVPFLTFAIIAFVVLIKSKLKPKFNRKYPLFIMFFAAFIFLMGYSGPRLIYPLIAAATIFVLVEAMPAINSKARNSLLFGLTLAFLLSFFFSQGPLT